MGLNIKNSETERAIRELASSRGMSLTEAVDFAVRKVAAEDEAARRADIERRLAAIAEIQARVAARIRPDAPTIEQIMEDMYDENGAPK